MQLRLYGTGGNLIRSVASAAVGHQSPLTPSTSAIRIGAWRTGTTSRHDGPIGRVIWCNQRLNSSQQLSVALARTIIP
jgi:hypothetical protein